MSYIVRYREKDTEKEIASPKLVENQTFGETVTEEAIDVDGYIAENPTTQSVEITAGTNKIIFYYASVYDIHVKHVFEDGEEGDVALPDDYDIENLKPGTNKILEAEAVEGYVAYPSTKTATIEN